MSLQAIADTVLANTGKAISLLVLAAFGSCGLGCAAPALPKEFGQAAKATVVSLTDQASWQSMAASVDGQVIEPGVEAYAGILYVVGGKLKGVSGHVGISGQGVGTGVTTDEARAKILSLIENDPAFIDQLVKLIEVVRSNATKVEPTPAPQ